MKSSKKYSIAFVTMLVVAFLVLGSRAFSATALCFTEKSPDGRFRLEARYAPIAGLGIAMPGDGGCGGKPGVVVLADGDGRALRSQKTDRLDDTRGTVEWSMANVSFIYDRVDSMSADWPLPR